MVGGVAGRHGAGRNQHQVESKYWMSASKSPADTPAK
jgi:hypothetical protein